MNTPSIKGASGKPEFQKLLRKWVKGVEAYGEWWQWEDCSWLHRERPSLSILSGAVWKLGGVAIEEWRAAKLSKSKHGCGFGRCDLSFGLIGPNRKPKNYDAESKHVWCKLDQPAAGEVERALRQLDRACDDAACLKDCPNKLGIVFVSFAITGAGGKILPAAKRKTVAEKLPGWVTEFLAAIKEPGISAAWFVLTGKEHVDCPGGAVLIRETV